MDIRGRRVRVTVYEYDAQAKERRVKEVGEGTVLEVGFTNNNCRLLVLDKDGVELWDANVNTYSSKVELLPEETRVQRTPTAGKPEFPEPTLDMIEAL
jgi:hypothetical protein